MFTKLKIFFGTIISKTFQKDQYKKTLNLPILIIIIIIDLFLILNIFSGLSNVTVMLGDSNKFYPCNYEIENVKELHKENESIKEDRKIDYISNLNYSEYYYDNKYNQPDVDSYCKEFGNIRSILIKSNTVKSIIADNDNLKLKISSNESLIKNLQSQYDSTLLEKIAIQEEKNSINLANSQTTKDRIEVLGKENISYLEVIKNNRKLIINNQEVRNYLAYPIENTGQYLDYRKRLSDFEFWLPVKSLILQLFYLTPIILISFLLSKFFASKQWQILGVISWNIFLLSFIPLVLKIMNFLQFGTIFNLIYNFFAYIFGPLFSSFVFLLSYLYIITIPLVGYLLIWILQKTIFNKRLTYKKRIARGHCINCDVKLRDKDLFCTSCGISQYESCQNCHQSSRVGAVFCQYCGTKK